MNKEDLEKEFTDLRYNYSLIESDDLEGFILKTKSRTDIENFIYEVKKIEVESGVYPNFIKLCRVYSQVQCVQRDECLPNNLDFTHKFSLVPEAYYLSPEQMSLSPKDLDFIGSIFKFFKTSGAIDPKRCVYFDFNPPRFCIYKENLDYVKVSSCNSSILEFMSDKEKLIFVMLYPWNYIHKTFYEDKVRYSATYYLPKDFKANDINKQGFINTFSEEDVQEAIALSQKIKVYGGLERIKAGIPDPSRANHVLVPDPSYIAAFNS